jgi:hypothetical protein
MSTLEVAPHASVEESEHLDQTLHARWLAAVAGDFHARAEWLMNAGSQWEWQDHGLVTRCGIGEWATSEWLYWRDRTLQELGNVLIAVTVSGKALAAGISFGDFKDFLIPLEPQSGPRRLQLEIDLAAQWWAFRVDGQVQERRWWNSQVHSVQDLASGRLTLKAQQAERVVFQHLRFHRFQASCHLSIIMTCHRFVKRLRLSLRNWCEQTLPFGMHEILVVNPASPDGTHEHLATEAAGYPHVRVREVPVGADLVRNKGAMINRAVQFSRGEWIWLTDADCLFPPNAAETALACIRDRRNHLYFGQRRHLNASQTEALLTGRLDGLRDFYTLTSADQQRAPDSVPWGYTQIVHRSTLDLFAYREHINHFAESDNVFIEDCLRHGIWPSQVPGLFCLHLDHPFAWYGTDRFL